MLFSRHSLTILSLVLGVIGSLYLSYDLLGKPRGILRRLILGISISAFAGIFETSFALVFIPFLASFLGATSFILGFIAGFSSFPTDQELLATKTWLSNIKFALLSKRALSYFGIYSTIASISSVIVSFVKLHRLDVSIVVFFLVITYCVVLIVFIAVIMTIFFRFYVYLSRFTSKLTERRLGAIGAFLTLIAFVIQLCLAVFD